MRETLKSIAKLTAGYSLVTLIGPLFTILLTPLYTRVLEPSDYGVVDVSVTFIGLLSTLITIGIETALNSHFWNNTTDRASQSESQRNIATTAIVTVASLTTLAGIACFAFANQIATILFGEVTRKITIQIASVSIIFLPIYTLSLALLKQRMGVKRVSALGLIYLITLITCNVVFVLIFRWRATGILAGNAIAATVGCIAGVALLWSPLRGVYRSDIAKSLIQSGVSLLPSLLGFGLLANIDRLILTQFVSSTELGIYAIANRIASMLSIVMSAGLTAWIPIALKISSKSDAKKQYARITEFFLAAACFFALGGGLFSKEILAIFTRDAFISAAPYASMLMIYNGPIIVLASLFSLGFYIQKKEGLISVAYLIAVTLNILLNLIFDKSLNILGATIATLVGGMSLVISVYVLCQAIYRVTYRWLRLSATFASYVCMLIVGNLFFLDNALVRFCLLLAFVGSLFLLKITSVQHLRMAANTLSGKMVFAAK